MSELSHGTSECFLGCAHVSTRCARILAGVRPKFLTVFARRVRMLARVRPNARTVRPNARQSAPECSHSAPEFSQGCARTFEGCLLCSPECAQTVVGYPRMLVRMRPNVRRMSSNARQNVPECSPECARVSARRLARMRLNAVRCSGGRGAVAQNLPQSLVRMISRIHPRRDVWISIFVLELHSWLCNHLMF